MSVNDTSKIAIDSSRVMFQTVVSLTDDSRGVIYDHDMFIEQATVNYTSILRANPFCTCSIMLEHARPFWGIPD